MLLTNEFDVAAPLPQVWELFDDVAAVIPCMPGASYLGREGDDYRVGIKVKIGVITTNFQGVVRFVERNPAAHKVVLNGSGKDTTGKGSATAIIDATLSATEGGHTHVCVKTDLSLSGRIAQFGSSFIPDIASRLVSQFTENLHSAVLVTHAAPSAPTSAPSSSEAPAQATAPALERQPKPAVRESEALDVGAALLPILRQYVLSFSSWVAIFALGFAAGRFL